MRQRMQHLEISSMSLSHQNDELKSDLRQLAQEIKASKDELVNCETLLIKQRQECKLHHAGLLGEQHGSGNSQLDHKTHLKLVEQRKQIKFLQGLLIRAKQDFDQVKRSEGRAADDNLLNVD